MRFVHRAVAEGKFCFCLLIDWMGGGYGMWSFCFFVNCLIVCLFVRSFVRLFVCLFVDFRWSQRFYLA